MKFDKIIMNPPYDGNLHLKILEQAISLLKDDGNCINLSPIGLVQKYYTLGNTRILDFSDIFDNEISITKIPIRRAMTIFHLDSLGQDLGLWEIRKSLKKTDISDLGKSLVDHIEIVDKIKNKMKGFPSLKDVQVRYSQINTEFPLKFVYGLTLANHGGFGTSCYAPTSMNYETAINPIPGNHTVYICFESERERKNAHTFYTLMGMRFFYKEIGLSDTPYNVVGYMRGMFDREWTDKDFYEYFGITEQEQKEIEEAMKPYM